MAGRRFGVRRGVSAGEPIFTTKRSVNIQNDTAWLDFPLITLTGNYTIECWFYFIGGSIYGYSQILSSSVGNVQLFNSNGNAGTQWEFYNNGSIVIGGSVSADTNVWRHLAMIKSGTTVTMYINGTSIGSGTDNTSLSVSRIGAYSAGGYSFIGNISNMRILDGTALYTSNFTAPTFPFTSARNPLPKLLTCRNTSFIDDSPNAYTITPTGSVVIDPYTP